MAKAWMLCAVVLLTGCAQPVSEMRSDYLADYKNNYMTEIAEPSCANAASLKGCTQQMWKQHYAENFASINSLVNNQVSNEQAARSELLRANAANMQNTMDRINSQRPRNCYSTGAGQMTCY